MMRWLVIPIACLTLTAAFGCAHQSPQTAVVHPFRSATTGHIVIGPYVQPASQPDMAASLRIVWWSDVPGAASLEVHRGDGSAETLKADSVSLEGLYRHAVEVEGRRQASVMVQAGIDVGGKLYSATPQRISFPGARADRPLRFAATGDEGAGNDAERKVVEQMARERPEAIIIAGDVVYNSGEFSEYRSNFLPYYRDLMSSVPVLPALGNHDAGNPQHLGRPFTEVWMPPITWLPPKGDVTPYTILKRRANRGEGPVPLGQWFTRNYSADAGDCHFLCLDSTADRETMDRLIVPWAKKDLAEAKQNGAKWIIAFWHHPPYTHGAYRDNSLQWKDIREAYVPLLREAGVQIVLNGHDHGYQHMRKDGTDYIVTGAGGARLYPIDRDYSGNGQPPLLGANSDVHSFTMFEESGDHKTMAVRQIDENGHLIDAFRLSAE